MFQVGLPVPAVKDLEGEEHLLGCIHKYVSSFLEIPIPEKDEKRHSRCQRISNKMGRVAASAGGIFGCISGTPEVQHESESQHYHEGQQNYLSPYNAQNFLKRYNAEELVKAGIRIRPLPNDPPLPKDPPRRIRFDIKTRTLYLPRIEVVGNYTEVMLRNLVALELNDPKRPKAVANFVTLMDSLIDSPKDVGLLRARGVIFWQNLMITNDYVAEMWNGMRKPLIGGMMEAPLALRSQIIQLLCENFHITRFKTLWWEFRKLFLSKPWTVVGLLVRIFLVLVVQFMFVGQYSLGWPNFKWKCPLPKSAPNRQ